MSTADDPVVREIDEIRAELGPLLRKRDDFAAANALALMAAHHAIHDGADEEDFLKVCQAAWRRSEEIHRRGCKQ